MPLLRRSDEEERQNLLEAQRWKIRRLRLSTTVPPRRHRRPLRRVPVVASVERTRSSRCPGAGQAFRRRTALEFWEVWPMPVPDGEFRRVLFVDGIWLAERLVVLICCSEDQVVSWYMAQSENSRAWSALMGDTGARRGRRRRQRLRQGRAFLLPGPDQGARCLFHAYAQVKECTTTEGRLRRDGKDCTRSPIDLAHIRRCARRSTWRDAISTGAALVGLPGGHYARRRKEGRIRTESSGRRGGRSRRWSPRERRSPSSTPSSRRPGRSIPITR